MNNLSKGEQILFMGFSVNDLLLRIEQIIDSKIGNLPQNEDNKSDYITRKEAASILKITLPTLHDWTKQGWLQSYKIGNRVLYSKQEVEDSLRQVISHKYKKGGRP
jgi:excisionase family DNA binding protein